MASGCHHGIEGPCMVCDRVAERKQEPVGPPRILHLAKSDGSPICGSQMSPDERISNLNAHNTERFCRLCLVVRTAHERRAAEASKKAWRARPRREKIAAFNHTMFGPDNLYSFAPNMLLRFVILSGLVILVGATWVFFGGGAAAVNGVMYIFLVWHIGVSRS